MPEVPTVSEITGQVNRYDKASGGFVPVQIGEKFRPHPLLYGCRIRAIISYPAKIVARFGENTRAVVEPEEDGRYEVDLQLGTVTAFLDPKRDKEKEPAFAIVDRVGSLKQLVPLCRD